MKEEGFTLVEMVVVLAVVAILAAILVPTIAKNIQDANIARAQNETKVIAAAIASFYKDLGRWPTADGFTPDLRDVHWLIAGFNGDQTSQVNNWNKYWGLDETDFMEFQLIQNDPGRVGGDYPYGDRGPYDYPTTGRWRWRGPYIAEIPADPFGIHYSCNVRYFWDMHNGQPGAVYVLSAGPNKLWDTPFGQPLPGTIGGDDIGTPIR